MAEAKKRFWHRWRWYRIRLAKEKIRLAESRFNAICERIPAEGDVCLEEEAREAGDIQAQYEDDIDILFQDRLIRSARRWRIHVPSPSDKESWGRFAYRKQRPMLKPAAAHAIHEQRIQRWLMLFGLLFGASSIVQAVFAVLSYLRW